MVAELLVQMKNVTQVDLRYAAVTAEGVDRLHKARPDCAIIWAGGTVNPAPAED